MKREKIFVAIVATGILVAGGCGKKDAQSEERTPIAESSAAPVAPIDPATTGTISGTVRFEGAAPKLAKVDMSEDPGCKGENWAESIVVNDGNLANVFVYVKEGLGARRFDVPKEAVTLTQSGCKYIPHVLGMMAGQAIRIVNADPTVHNVHPAPKHNEEWNESQTAQSPSLDKVFSHEELLLPITCNQHPWMRMFVNVVKNPFYAVTGVDGKFEIRGLPPGDYSLGFVQEKVGQQEEHISLAVKENKNIEVTFKQ